MRKPAIPATIDPALMARMGLRIEGPGAIDSGALAGRYWWTWTRDGWSGIECGADHPSWTAAAQDAWQTLWTDEDRMPELLHAEAALQPCRPADAGCPGLARSRTGSMARPYPDGPALRERSAAASGGV